MTVRFASHLGICVSDSERSLRFYRDLLGFRPLSSLVVSDPHSAQLLEVDDLELNAFFLERDGMRIEILKQTRIHNPELRSEVVYVLDPDGVRIELVQLPGDPTLPLGMLVGD